MTIQEEMMALIKSLNDASAAYYGSGSEQMSNYEWDEKLNRLQELEKSSGIVLSMSPTLHVGAAPLSSLRKEAHEVPALSLDKTKEVSVLCDFLEEEVGVLSWKLDGLTIVLTYNHGQLVKAVTRGNGQMGEVVTENAKQFQNVPLTVPEMGKMIVRGEALITYDDFQRINASLPDGEEPYKNPRNLCAGSVRQLNPKEVRRRNVQFIAFDVAFPGGSRNPRNGTSDPYYHTFYQEQMTYLKDIGFTTIECTLARKKTLPDKIEAFKAHIGDNAFPSDGLVLRINHLARGAARGTTSKFPRNAMAFKWEDEVRETTVTDIFWSASRTGRINPIAIFEPVELEGTTVSRASIHNVSIVKDLQITPGDTITVYKANMIIPQVAENKTRHAVPIIPETCPVCGGKAVRKMDQDSEVLWCENPDCAAKHVGAFVHAVSRDALNVEGLSEATIRTFIKSGLLQTLGDLFRLPKKKEQIVNLDGFGLRSYENLVKSLEAAKTITLQRLLYALGIPNVGRTASKAICNALNNEEQRILLADKETLQKIPDIGETIAANFVNWFKDPGHQELWEDLRAQVIVERPLMVEFTPLSGMTFVITGSLNHFPNRDALKAKIESVGGKVSGSVSKNTTYLINNDRTSTSGKNKKAKELNIPIITEETLITLYESDHFDVH